MEETLKVKVDTTEVDRGSVSLNNLAAAGGKASASTVIAETSWGRYAASLANPITATLALGTALVATGIKAVRAAEEARLSIARLDIVYKNAGSSIGMTLTDLEAQIQRLAESSKFDDEDIRAGAIEFARFGNISKDVLKSLMDSSVEYATFMGISVAEASRQFAKAAADTEAAGRLLKNAGIALTNTEQKYISILIESGREMESKAFIAKKLQDATDGMKDSMAGLGETYSGAIRDIGEAFEALGKTAPLQFVSDQALNSMKAFAFAVKEIAAALNGSWTDKLLVLSGAQGLTNTLGMTSRRVQTMPSTVKDSSSPLPALPNEKAMRDEIAAAEAKQKAMAASESSAKSAIAKYAQLITDAKEYAAALKLETEQIGMNVVQKRMMSDAAEAAKAPTAALRLEIMTNAQALAESTAASENAATAAKFYSDAVTGLADIEHKQTTALQDQIDALKTSNAQIGKSAEQVREMIGLKELEEAAIIRTAAAYAGPMSDAYLKYADGLVIIAEKQRELADEKNIQDAAEKAVALQKDALNKMTANAIGFQTNIQRTMGTELYNIMSGNFRNIGDAFYSMLQRMLADALAAQLAQAIFGSNGSGGGGGGSSWLDIGLSAASMFLGGGKTGSVSGSTTGASALSGSMALWPSYAQGTNFVPNDGLAYLHAGEAVVPREFNSGSAPKTESSSKDRAMTIVNNFTLSGPVDKRTQGQLASTAGVAIKRAMARNT